MFDPAFTSLSEFLAMGSYARYVWFSYALTFLVFAGNLILYFINRKKVFSDLVRAQKRHKKQQEHAGKFNQSEHLNQSTKTNISGEK